MDQNRKSRTAPAEASRESVRNSSGDLGTSSDRAMFNDEPSTSGRGSGRSGSGSSGSSERGSGSSSERGSSSSGERGVSSDNRPGSSRSSERGMGSGSERNRSSESSGGITNRELSREQCEQDQLPERGRSKSEG